MKFEEKLSDGARRGAGCLLVAVLAASGLACVPGARVASGQRAEERVVERLGGNRGDLRAGGGGAGAVRRAEGPLSEVTAVVSVANLQRLRELARVE